MKSNLINQLKHILYVEDDSDDQDIFLESLREVAPNSTCHVVNNADEARDFLNQSEITMDYIFLDINMPKTDGITFLKEIKQDEIRKSIPVIIYSTASNQTYIDRCKELGAIEYFPKPNTFKAVCNILKQYCS